MTYYCFLETCSIQTAYQRNGAYILTMHEFDMVYTLHTWRAFSTMLRSFISESRVLPRLAGAQIFFSFNLETDIGSKSKNTSLQPDKQPLNKHLL